MTTPAIDTRQHTAAVLAAINDTIAPHEAYTYDKVPGGPYMREDGDDNALPVPSIYAAVSVERRYVPPLRGGHAGRSGWRASVRFVGRSVAEAAWCELQVAEALNEARLTVDGLLSTPVQHEATTTPEWDGERWSGLAQYVYAI